MKYLEELRKEAGVSRKKVASSGKAKIKAKSQSMKGVKKKLLGYETKGDAAFYPMPPLTLTSVLSATKLPSTKPSYEKILLPDAKFSPTVGLGMGGVQMRLRIKRDTAGVPAGSIVDQGLKNQSGTGGAADIGLKRKNASGMTALLEKLNIQTK